MIRESRPTISSLLASGVQLTFLDFEKNSGWIKLTVNFNNYVIPPSLPNTPMLTI